MDFVKGLFGAKPLRGRITEETKSYDEQLRESGLDEPEKWHSVVKEMSSSGKLLEAQYGPISEEELRETIANRTPEEAAWESKARWEFLGWVGLATVTGAGVGWASGEFFCRNARAARAKQLGDRGKKGYYENETLVQLSDWVTDARKVRRAKALHILCFTFLFGNFTFWRLWPSYVEKIASMPGSKVALAIKRWHRGWETQQADWNVVSDEDIAEMENEVEFESKKSYAGQPVSAEGAAAAGLSMGLTGGYKAGGV
eukprot:TRINITY_DN29544_c0_g1_i1.p1 TRINITY_DN29544_c0_g1~~TRINITY_DN29544_c0_g1_i1.p1  ORF type:complete len:290 (+),score=91.61 TRINITY_DN29544_c0_g1_i1:102-872(+)